MLARSAVSAARSTGSKRARTRPASMRENSSSVFTSFSSRRLLRCATSSCSRIVAGSASPDARASLERAEQQRQRRAELVADVGEERRLGAIDLGERLGAAALLLVGAHVGEAGGDLAGEELTKPRYASSSGRNGFSPATRTRGALLPGCCDRGGRARCVGAPCHGPVGSRRASARARRRRRRAAAGRAARCRGVIRSVQRWRRRRDDRRRCRSG